MATADGGSDLVGRGVGAVAASVELAVLAELVARIARAAELEPIAQILARDAKWVIPNERCTLTLVDEQRRGWRLYPGDVGGKLADLRGPIELALSRSTAVVLDDAADRATDFGATAAGFLPGARSVMILPLECEGDPFGTLNLSSSRAGLYPRAPTSIATLLRLNVAAAVRNASNLARFRQLDVLKSRLVADVSHDYRSPLTTIVGYCELLLAKEYGVTDQRQMLTYVLDEALRLSRLVDEVLDLSQVSQGGTRLLREPLDFASLVDYCLGSYSTRAGAPPTHSFRVTVEPDLPSVWGDRSRILRALMNLIGNAVKYSPAGGEVAIVVRASADRREAAVAVTDHGMGIDPADIPTLFQAFRRTREAEQAGIEGTGLGLAIAREIAEAHGGRLWAESAGVGHGATFWLALPIRGSGRGPGPRGR